MLNTPVCLHRVLEGNIQEFVLTEVTRRAIDELFDTAESLLANAHARQDLSVIAGAFLLDSSVGILPLNYSFARARAMSQKFPTHPQSRTACLLPPSPLLRTVDLFLRSFGPLRVYSIHQREEALAWLRSSRPS